jgi:hypothetical protein
MTRSKTKVILRDTSPVASSFVIARNKGSAAIQDKGVEVRTECRRRELETNKPPHRPLDCRAALAMTA